MNSLLAIYAIVAGHNGSASPSVTKLRYADDDAAAYARLFRDSGAQVKLLTRFDADSAALNDDVVPDAPPTREALLAAVADAPPGADVVIAYAGHGDVENGQGYVELEGSRLTRGDFYDRVLTPLRGRRVHVIVDACKSYFLVFDRGAGGTRHRYAGSFVDRQGSDRFPNVGFILSTSSAADSHEWEEFQAGVFSHEVRSGLRGAADVDRDGRISYAELGAFLVRANAAVPNPRFRPKFAVAAPQSSPQGAQTAVLHWSSPAQPLARRLSTQRPSGRLYVEDARGLRLMDANSQESLLAWLPSGPLFVRSGEREFAVAAQGDTVLEEIASVTPSIARRGALHEAFRHLFAAPFGADDVTNYLKEPPPTVVVTDFTEPSSRGRVQTIAGITALSAAAVGIGLTLGAYGKRKSIDADASQVERAQANDTIRALNIAAIVSYGVAAATGVTWLALEFWPDGAGAGIRVATP